MSLKILFLIYSYTFFYQKRRSYLAYLRGAVINLSVFVNLSAGCRAAMTLECLSTLDIVKLTL